MSNALQTLTQTLAAKLNMGSGEGLIETLKATAFKAKEGVSDAQMTALMIVSNQYGLNPWTKEIYAYPDKANGIVPVVGLDGWSRIINSNTQFDGMDFEQNDESCTCTIYRKDRTRPVRVTEYHSECYRPGFKKDGYEIKGPWQSHPKRMLRHKAMIQCARLAFGFVGIYDQDEAERIVESTSIDASTGEVTPKAAPARAEKSICSDEKFDENRTAWRELIKSGKKTTQQLIAMLSSKTVLTEDQLVEIDSWNHEE
ncbi:MAG: phage recombination protein Bet [Polynucleobacter sp.]